MTPLGMALNRPNEVVKIVYNMEQHVFSKSNKFFASITDNGGLKVWDVETQEPRFDYIPNLQTSAPCTCLIWVTVKQTKRSAIVHDAIVLGTRKGNVSIFSTASGKVESTLKGVGHSGAVTGICYDDEHTVYTSGEDSKIIVWNLNTGSQVRGWDIGNERPTALALSLDKQKLITASRQIKLWSIPTSECKHNFTGHASAVQFLKVIQFEDAEYLVSASKSNRVLSIWNLRATSKKKDSMATFSLEDVPVFLDAICVDGTLAIVAVCRNNIAYQFLEKMEDVVASVKPFKFSKSLNVVADHKTTAAIKSVEAIPILAAALDELNKVIIAYGNTLTLVFENVRVRPGRKAEVLVRNDPRKIYSKSKAAGNNLGVMEPIVDATQVEYALIAPTKKALKPNEIQIEKRLENLSLAKGDAVDLSASGTNMTQLLIQGLHSNDATILDEIFRINDRHSVRSTLQKLPPQYIGALVNQLTGLMQKKIDHVETGVSWMKVLLQTHTSQLMALGPDELMNRFGPCMGIIEHRVHNLKNLNRVKGRLDLLLNQMEDRPHMDPIETPNEHMLVFQDQSDGSADEKDADDGSSYGSSDDEGGENGHAMNGVENGTSASEEDENMVSEDDEDSAEDEEEDDDEALESD